MADVNLIFRLYLLHLSVIDLFGLVLRHSVAHVLVEIRIPQSAAPMIFQPLLEALAAVEAGLNRGLGHQFVLHNELQEHATAMFRGYIGELEAHFRCRKVKVRLLDVDTVDFSDDCVVG